MVDPNREVAENEGPGNNHAGWPTPTGLCAWYEIDVEVCQEPELATGYIIGIDVIDRAVRSAAIPILQAALREDSPPGIAHLVGLIRDQTEACLGIRPSSLGLRLSPRHELTWTTRAGKHENRKTMTATDDTLLIREDFEFAASHRLHCPEQSEEWNRETFGKCNNPQGHGHNYRVRVVAETPMGADGMPTLGFARLEEIVTAEVIARFDHRHLNKECPEFSDLNPSVENISRVCRDLLIEPIREAGGSFDSVTVWETEKTSCTCR